MDESLVLQYYNNLHNLIKDEAFLTRELEIRQVPHKIVGLVGPRRAGKTFLMLNLMKKQLKRSIYFDFELTFFKNLDFKSILQIINLYEAHYQTKVQYIYFDEIQSLKQWQSTLRNFENMGYYIMISGSSSKLLNEQISTGLRGRTITYALFPFSFREFLRSKDVKLNKHYSIEEKTKILQLLKEYLSYGGFPEVVLRKEREMILKEYKDLIFFKDFIERFNIEHVEVATMIYEFLLQNFSCLISINKISNFIKQRTGTNKKNIVYSYINDLQKTFLFFFIEKYDASVFKRASWPKKTYVIDNGLTRFYAFNTDMGKLMENTVFLHLKRMENEHPYLQIYYYKTKNNKEIDFLIKEKENIGLIEVCYFFDQQHLDKIITAMEELNLETGMCISWDEERIYEKNGKKIRVVPLWKWLVNFPDSGNFFKIFS